MKDSRVQVVAFDLRRWLRQRAPQTWGQPAVGILPMQDERWRFHRFQSHPDRVALSLGNPLREAAVPP